MPVPDLIVGPAELAPVLADLARRTHPGGGCHRRTERRATADLENGSAFRFSNLGDFERSIGRLATPGGEGKNLPESMLATAIFFCKRNAISFSTFNPRCALRLVLRMALSVVVSRMKTRLTPCSTAKPNAGALPPLTECARVVIADRYPVIRKGLTTVLEAEPDFRLGQRSNRALSPTKRWVCRCCATQFFVLSPNAGHSWHMRESCLSAPGRNSRKAWPTRSLA